MSRRRRSPGSFLDNTCFSEMGVVGRGGAISGSGVMSLERCTLAGNAAEIGSGIAYGSGANPGTLTVDNTIVVFNSAGIGVQCGANASALLACSDVYGNAGGDWVGCIAGQAGLREPGRGSPVLRPGHRRPDAG